MNKIYIGIAVAIMVGIGIFWRLGISKNEDGLETVTQIPTSEPSSSFAPLPSGSLQGFWGPTGLREPANCTLSGSIEFTQKNIYVSNEALFTYNNVDDDARNVRWVVSPTDDLRIGPNLFSSLLIPDGQATLTIALPEPQKARAYTLTAYVNYGQVIETEHERNVVVKEAKCKGSIPVKLLF